MTTPKICMLGMPAKKEHHWSMRECGNCGKQDECATGLAGRFQLSHQQPSGPWQESARWFRDTLVDADLANNIVGWQWSAGCRPDATPYFRLFNPVTQAHRFDPDGQSARRWVPELAQTDGQAIFAPWDASALPGTIRNRSSTRGESPSRVAAYAASGAISYRPGLSHKREETQRQRVPRFADGHRSRGRRPREVPEFASHREAGL